MLGDRGVSRLASECAADSDFSVSIGTDISEYWSYRPGIGCVAGRTVCVGVDESTWLEREGLADREPADELKRTLEDRERDDDINHERGGDR